MLRVLALIAALIVLRECFVRRRKRSRTANSPYMNSLDGAVGVERLSLALEEAAKFRTHLGSKPACH
jgi:hypothetical protein